LFPLRHNITAGVTAETGLTATFVEARKAAEKMLKIVVAEDGASSLQILRGKATVLTSIDATFVIELAVLEQLQEEPGTTLMENGLLDLLPVGKSSKQSVSIDVASAALLALRESALYKYTGPKAKSCCEVLQEMLAGMQKGHPPDIKALQVSAFLRKVMDRLPFMAQCVEPLKAPGGIARVVTGVDSLQVRLDMCMKKDSEGKLVFDDLHELHIFDHWLTEAQRKQRCDFTTKLVGHMIAKDKSSGATSVAALSGSKPAQKVAKPARRAPTKKDKDNTDGQSTVMSLFA